MKNKRGSILIGSLLVLAGVLMLGQVIWPEAFKLAWGRITWPWIIIGVGAMFLIGSLLESAYGMAIPGTIITTIGGILLYQNQTGNWESWAYVWALIPSSVGLGMLIMGFLGKLPASARVGLWLLIGNLLLFLIFWSFFSRETMTLVRYWPVALIALGGFLLIQTFFHPENRN